MIRKSTLSTVGTYVKEHYPNAAYGAYPIENDTKVAVVIVATKYSPHNFWYGPLSPPIPLRHGMLTEGIGMAAGARFTFMIPRQTPWRDPSRLMCTIMRMET